MAPETRCLDRMAMRHCLCVLLFAALFLQGISSEELTGMCRLTRSSSTCPHLKLTNGKTEIVDSGRSISFRCNPAFRLFGVMLAGCTSSGKLDQKPPVCVAPGCPNIWTSLPKNLKVKSRRWSNALVSFRCAKTFTMVGSETIFCNGKEWNDSVPMCYDTPTSATTLESCNFERDQCEWSQSSRDDFDWARGSATKQVGPSVDHTYGTSSGHFLYVGTNASREIKDSAVLISQRFPARWSGNCFQFWYNMFDGDSNRTNSMASSLEVFVSKAGDSLFRLPPSVHVQGNQRDVWHLGQVEIPKLTTDFQIVMNATCGRSSNVAIDDVTLFRCSKGGATTSAPTTEKTSPIQTTTEDSAAFVETTEATTRSTSTKKEGALRKPVIVGKAGAAKEEPENSESNSTIVIVVSVCVGAVAFVVIVVVLVVWKMKSRRRNAVNTTASENIVTAAFSFNSNAQSTVVDIPKATVKNMA